MTALKTKAKKEETERIVISPPKFELMRVRLVGTAPYMQCRFSQKAIEAMREAMEAGSKAKSKRKREPRDFDADFVNAQHYSDDGWVGVPASAIRSACIDACRMVGFKMTHMKMSLFVKEDGFDSVDADPLIKLDAGDPERNMKPVRLVTGVMDIRCRPMWREWALNPVVEFDTDQFSASDVVNLLSRAGQQVGIGEGRPFSRNSAGMGFGTFKVE